MKEQIKMDGRYLSANFRERTLDLMSGRGITQEQLANATGDERTRLSRFLSGKTDSMNYTQVMAIARYFGVTTDFLLGLTDDCNSGSGLRLGKADAGVVQKLLDNKNFVTATRHIRQYLDESLAAGIAIQNQILSSAADFSLRMRPDLKQIPEDISLLKRLPHQPDEELIERYFMAAVKEIKRENGSRLIEEQKKTKELMERVTSDPAVMEQVINPDRDPEAYANAVIDAAIGNMQVPEKVTELAKKLLQVLIKMFGRKKRNDDRRAG